MERNQRENLTRDLLHDLVDIHSINILVYFKKSASALWSRIDKNIDEKIANKLLLKKDIDQIWKGNF